MKRTIGLVTAVALSGAAYAQDVKVGGYVDGGFNWTKDAEPSSMFTTNAASVTVSGNSGGSFGFVELGAANVGGAMLTTFEQWYGGHKYENGLTWKVGFFNGLLGAEDNESTGRAFINEGAVSSTFLANYAGLHIGYAASDNLNIDLVVGNGAPTFANLEKPMYAVKLSTKMDDVSAYVGAEMQEAITGAGNDSDYHVDLGVAAKLAELHVGAEVAMTKVGGGDSGFGFGVHASYAAMENVDIVARFDWGNDNFYAFAVDANDDGDTTDAGETGVAKIMEITAGPNFKLSDAFNVRAQWTMTKVGDGDAGQGINVMGVYKF